MKEAKGQEKRFPIYSPLSSKKSALLSRPTYRHQRQQACPPDPCRLPRPQPVQRKIHLVHVFHHLPELLRLHQRRRRRGSGQPRRRILDLPLQIPVPLSGIPRPIGGVAEEEDGVVVGVGTDRSGAGVGGVEGPGGGVLGGEGGEGRAVLGAVLGGGEVEEFGVLRRTPTFAAAGGGVVAVEEDGVG